ncbi:MAG: hypothetical protein QW534_07275 [Candidatus Methanomethylicia archaeon]
MPQHRKSIHNSYNNKLRISEAILDERKHISTITTRVNGVLSLKT